jgi:hypothetical protein
MKQVEVVLGTIILAVLLEVLAGKLTFGEVCGIIRWL